MRSSTDSLERFIERQESKLAAIALLEKQEELAAVPFEQLQYEAGIESIDDHHNFGLKLRWWIKPDVPNFGMAQIQIGVFFADREIMGCVLFRSKLHSKVE